MAALQLASSRERLISSAEHHSEDDIEGPVKPADRIAQRAGMLGDGSGDPRVRELHQQCATRSQKSRHFPVDAPNDGSGAENTGRPSRRRGLNQPQLTFKIGLGDDGR